MRDNQNDHIPFKELPKLFSSNYNPIFYNFKFEKENVDRDRCRLARSFYSVLFDVDSADKNHANNHLWSYDTINSFQTPYNLFTKLYCGFKKVSRETLQSNHSINLRNERYKEFIELEYLIHFKSLTGTIGNFTVIPFYTITTNKFIRSTNQSRTEYFDYDLKLIKDSFTLMGFVERNFYSSSSMNDFQEDFINRFLLQPYYNNGSAIPLIDPKHRNDIKELKRCILEMMIRIIKRGLLIVESYAQKNDFHHKSRIFEECKTAIAVYEKCKELDSCKNCTKGSCHLQSLREIINKSNPINMPNTIDNSL